MTTLMQQLSDVRTRQEVERIRVRWQRQCWESKTAVRAVAKEASRRLKELGK